MYSSSLHPTYTLFPTDPYKRCEEALNKEGDGIAGTSQCNHDCVRGVSAQELMGPDDGEFHDWTNARLVTTIEDIPNEGN